MARFGDMLYQRRRQMGLTILQVANTIKIRPQIIEFFENGDFTAMPPRGYAQGMISSYARYLGLNPREVVEAYFEDLRAYEQATDNHGGRFQDAAGLVSTRSASATGRFMMVDSAPRSRYAQRPGEEQRAHSLAYAHIHQLLLVIPVQLTWAVLRRQRLYGRVGVPERAHIRQHALPLPRPVIYDSAAGALMHGRVLAPGPPLQISLEQVGLSYCHFP